MPGASVDAAELDRSEFLQIPGQGRLGGLDALDGQQSGQFGLGSDRAAGDQRR